MRDRPRATRRVALAASFGVVLGSLPARSARADDVPARVDAATAPGAPAASAGSDGPSATRTPGAPTAHGGASQADAAQSSSAPWILVASGGVALSVGIALGAWSVVEHRAARDLRGPGGGRSLDAEEEAAYDEAIALRDDLRIGSGIAAATALGLFVTGGVLFAIDELDAKEPGNASAARTPQLVPLLGPGFAGGAATIQFW